MLFTCSICGQIHEGFPAISFDAPQYYYNLSEEEQLSIAELDSDFCVIKYPGQTDRFIRVILLQKIIDYPEQLQYGVWVSLSEKSFLDYKENYDSIDHVVTYFGYLSTQIPGYDNTLSIKTNVKTAEGNNRPEIFPHEDQMDFEFVKHYYHGITIEEAEKRIHATSGS